MKMYTRATYTVTHKGSHNALSAVGRNAYLFQSKDMAKCAGVVPTIHGTWMVIIDGKKEFIPTYKEAARKAKKFVTAGLYLEPVSN